MKGFLSSGKDQFIVMIGSFSFAIHIYGLRGCPADKSCVRETH